MPDVQMTHAGTIVAGDAAEIMVAGAEFTRCDVVTLPRLIEPALLAVIQRELERASFYDRTHGSIGVEHCLSPGPLSAALEFLTNDVALFDIIRRITGCGPIGCFEGRVYRMLAAAGHYDSWHSDASGGRMIGMSVNLSGDLYRGGVFQIRDGAAGGTIHETHNIGAGDAIVFRIGRGVVHRITPVEGEIAKTALAGWFVPEPDYMTLLNERVRATWHDVGR